MVFAPHCGACLPCAEGRPGNCEPGQLANGAGTLLGGGMRLHHHGAKVFHHLGVSGFAEYCVAHRNSVIKINAPVSFEEAALFGCAVLTGVGAVVNTAKVAPGASVAIVGLGGVGFNALLGARLAGANEVIAIDLLEDKLALARTLGATHTLNAADPDLIARIKEITRGGADYTFEMAGSVKALEVAYRLARRGGMAVTAGLPHPEDRWPLQAVNLVAEEKTIKGSYMGSCLPERDIPRFLNLYQQGRLPVGSLMSSRIKLEDINGAFEKLAAGAVVRQLIVF
jgi:alcohol dehydrogenase